MKKSKTGPFDSPKKKFNNHMISEKLKKPREI